MKIPEVDTTNVKVTILGYWDYGWFLLFICSFICFSKLSTLPKYKNKNSSSQHLLSAYNTKYFLMLGICILIKYQHNPIRYTLLLFPLDSKKTEAYSQKT